jgi:hypothetical protein
MWSANTFVLQGLFEHGNRAAFFPIVDPAAVANLASLASMGVFELLVGPLFGAILEF